MNAYSKSLAQITTHDAAAYVRSQGWHFKGRFGEKAGIFNKEEHTLLIPLSEDFADFQLRMTELVQNLSRFENRSESHVLRDLSYASSDIIRLRLQNPLFEDGEVNLNQGIVFFDNAQKMIQAAARSTVSPKPYHLARAGKEADEFLEKARLGQTEIGSYILSILIPITPDLGDLESESPQPFGRKVTRRLAESLGSLQGALRSQVAHQSSDPFLQSVEKGVSANLCEALADIGSETDGSVVETMITWSKNRQAPNIPTRAKFTGSDFSFLRSAAASLKKKSWEEEMVLSGPVIRAESNDPESGGEVYIHAEVGDHHRKVKVALNKSDYQLANKAHLDSSDIEITGRIEKIGRYLTVNAPKDFALLEED